MPKGRPKRWKRVDIGKYAAEFHLHSWDYFGDLVYDTLLDYKTYVFRGHRCDNWRLEPTLDRLLKKTQPDPSKWNLKNILHQFKLSTRGRRGGNPPTLATENDWWALGQHHGLSTPLLDWTQSPYVAAFFAFANKKPDDTANRVIYGLARGQVLDKSKNLPEPNRVDFFAPLSDENARLVNQAGLFTRGPSGVLIDDWVKEHFGKDFEGIILFKIIIPSKDRTMCLRELNRMNINYLSLFPDLYGSCRHCNTGLAIDKY